MKKEELIAKGLTEEPGEKERDITGRDRDNKRR